MAIAWKKVLLSGEVVNADIKAGANITTNKLSGAISSIGSHGLGTSAWKNFGNASGNLPEVGSGGVGASQVVVSDGTAKLISESKQTAFNKAFGTGTSNIPAIGSTLVASRIVETDSNGKLITASKATAYNKPFGTSAGQVAQGNHNHALRNLSDIGGGIDLTRDGILWFDQSADSFLSLAINSGFNKAFGTSAGTVSQGNHGHDYSGTFHPLGGSTSVDFAVKNLTIAGEITQETVTELAVEDKTIILAKGAGSSSGGNGAGIVVDTSSEPTERPSLQWDSSIGWQMNKGEDIYGGGSLHNILSSRNVTSDPTSTQGAVPGEIRCNTTNGTIFIAVQS